jgi:SAM-dependent methyltransferase
VRPNAPSILGGVSRDWLRSDLAWRLSGWSFPTATLATVGRVLTPGEYLRQASHQMSRLHGWIPPKGRVLELGSGLGGNLLAIRQRVRSGVGLDVNPRYLRISRSLAARSRATNLEFVRFDGSHWPLRSRRFDLVFAVGVFERLPVHQVERLVSDLASSLVPGGVAVLYFLAEEARGTTFTRWLGEEAYVTWERDPTVAMLARAGLAIDEVIPWGEARNNRSGASTPVANVYICRAGSAASRGPTGNETVAPIERPEDR